MKAVLLTWLSVSLFPCNLVLLLIRQTLSSQSFNHVALHLGGETTLSQAWDRAPVQSKDPTLGCKAQELAVNGSVYACILSCSVMSDSLGLQGLLPSSSSVHGIIPAGMLEQVAISSYKEIFLIHGSHPLSCPYPSIQLLPLPGGSSSPGIVPIDIKKLKPCSWLFSQPTLPHSLFSHCSFPSNSCLSIEVSPPPTFSLGGSRRWLRPPLPHWCLCCLDSRIVSSGWKYLTSD